MKSKEPGDMGRMFMDCDLQSFQPAWREENTVRRGRRKRARILWMPLLHPRRLTILNSNMIITVSEFGAEKEKKR